MPQKINMPAFQALEWAEDIEKMNGKVEGYFFKNHIKNFYTMGGNEIVIGGLVKRKHEIIAKYYQQNEDGSPIFEDQPAPSGRKRLKIKEGLLEADFQAELSALYQESVTISL